MNAVTINGHTMHAQQANRGDLESAFFGLGFQEIAAGLGGESAVFAHPMIRNKVFKFANCCTVQDAPEDQLTEGVCGLTYNIRCQPADDPYLNFLVAINEQSNRYLPKVFGVELYQSIAGNYFHLTIIERLQSYFRRGEKVRDQYHPDKVNEAVVSGGYIDAAFEEAAKLIRPLLHRFDLDIHAGNLMFRKGRDAQLVLIDPIC